jgi:hypothetical protein
MSNFMVNLWESVFTPGPTPTLLIATNASFAALQLLFFALLIATYSVHFVILSGLCAGLWWAINWFAAEIRAAQAKEEEAKRIREARRQEKEREKGERRGSEGEGMDSGDDTEGVETEVEDKGKAKAKAKQVSGGSRAPRPETQSTVFVERPFELTADIRDSTPVAAGSTTGTTATEGEDARGARKRRGLGESTGELSTDSEWEKLSQDSGEK